MLAIGIGRARPMTDSICRRQRWIRSEFLSPNLFQERDRNLVSVLARPFRRKSFVKFVKMCHFMDPPNMIKSIYQCRIWASEIVLEDLHGRLIT